MLCFDVSVKGSIRAVSLTTSLGTLELFDNIFILATVNFLHGVIEL